MYRNAYQRGMLTIFFSCGSKPLKIWETHTQDGYISRFLDQDIKSMVLEIGGSNVSTTYMICPNGNRVLGITMPFLVMIVKNLKKYFSFEVTILDDTGTRRRFRVSNFQSTTQILPLCTVMPIGLSEGWNQIQFNLAEFTRRAYKKQFVEVQKLKINANIRLRRVYFSERLIPEEQLPPEYKLYFPLASNKEKDKKEAIALTALKPSTSQQVVPVRVLSRADVKSGSKVSVHSVRKLPSEAAITEQQEQTPIAQESITKPETEKAREQVVTESTNEAGEVAAIEEDEKEAAPEAEATEEDEKEAAPEAEATADGNTPVQTPAEVAGEEILTPTENTPASAEETSAPTVETPAPIETAE